VRSTDTVARLGGDEFTVILANLSDTSGVKTVADNIHDTMEKPFRLNGVDVYISACIGIALYPGDATDPDGLTDKADIAMYAAKRQGRNLICFYSDRLAGNPD
jgi:diguanylate cyclase (GGDEF)-like protein